MARENVTTVADDDSVLISALKVGGLAGIGGILFGGTVGILRSNTPVLWTAATAIQWALLGGTVWGIRGAVLTSRTPEERADPETKVYASTIGSGLGFPIVGAITRGRKNVIPGAVMGTILGFAGQKAYNFFDARHTASIASQLLAAQQSDTASPSASTTSTTIRVKPEQRPLLQRIGESKWSPFKVLSDEEYEDMLRRKLLRVDAEIAVIDDDLAKLGASGSTADTIGDEDERCIEQLDLARHLREPKVGDVGMREDQADREQIEMARRLRERLKQREG